MSRTYEEVLSQAEKDLNAIAISLIESDDSDLAVKAIKAMRKVRALHRELESRFGSANFSIP